VGVYPLTVPRHLLKPGSLQVARREGDVGLESGVPSLGIHREKALHPAHNIIGDTLNQRRRSAAETRTSFSINYDDDLGCDMPQPHLHCFRFCPSVRDRACRSCQHAVTTRCMHEGSSIQKILLQFLLGLFVCSCMDMMHGERPKAMHRGLLRAVILRSGPLNSKRRRLLRID
jgi:hypothetical protein